MYYLFLLFFYILTLSATVFIVNLVVFFYRPFLLCKRAFISADTLFVRHGFIFFFENEYCTLLCDKWKEFC
uniref:Uncharacterized protein n=1 Tax=Ciona intestinalis TaxID=7719 RepID=F6RM80_CIOIN